jgi:hypothetical protein
MSMPKKLIGILLSLCLLTAVFPLSGLALTKAATPSANKSAGHYQSAVGVNLSTVTPGATIYYTTDDTTPTYLSPKYTGAIQIDSNTSLRAIAMKSGMADSDEMVLQYTVGDTVAPTLTGVRDKVYHIGYAINVLAGVTAADNVDGKIIPTASPSTIPSKLGTTIVTYTAQDKAGNTTTAQAEFKVVFLPEEQRNHINSDTGEVNSGAVHPGAPMSPAPIPRILTITATAGDGGKISPAGILSLASGSSQTYVFTPDPGYAVSQVLVNGKTVQAAPQYTFTNITSNQKIHVAFKMTVLPTGIPFTDVTEEDWFYAPVRYAFESGIMKGTSVTLFEPRKETTRAMVVTMLHRLESLPAAQGRYFSDVSEDDWFYKAVMWASSQNIVQGYGGEEFGANDSVTREQLAQMLFNYAAYKSYDTSQQGIKAQSFNDYDQISPWAMGAVAWAVNAELMQGTDENDLNPKGTATRAEIATVFQRFITAFVK